jgi:hypothetical protein
MLPATFESEIRENEWHQICLGPRGHWGRPCDTNGRKSGTEARFSPSNSISIRIIPLVFHIHLHFKAFCASLLGLRHISEIFGRCFILWVCGTLCWPGRKTRKKEMFEGLRAVTNCMFSLLNYDSLCTMFQRGEAHRLLFLVRTEEAICDS